MLLDNVFFAPRRFLLSLGLDKVLFLTSFLFLISVLLLSDRVCSHSCIHFLHDLGCVVETYWYPSLDVPQMRLDGHLDLPPHVSHVPFNCY